MAKNRNGPNRKYGKRIELRTDQNESNKTETAVYRFSPKNNTEHSLTIGFIKSLVRQNFVRSDKIWNSVRPMSDKTLKYFDSTAI